MTSRRITLKTLAASLLAPFLPGCATPPQRPAQIAHGDHEAVIAHLRTWIPHVLNAAGGIGMSVALLDEQRQVWAEGFGFADREAGLPATALTRYRAGSISKLFTATAAMQLAEAGRLDIDAPLEQALPGFALRDAEGRRARVTPRDIMTHHAGLPADRIEGMWTHQPAYFTSLVELLRDERQSFSTGKVHAYSNVGFSLLGAAIEQVGGLRYADYMQRHLLAPLGMRDSVFESAPPSGMNAALGYDAEGRREEEWPLRDLPAGALNSTAPDLLHFARMQFAGGVFAGQRVLSAAAIEAMQRPQNAGCELDADLRVGLGWHFAQDAVQGGGPVLFHDGGTLTHRSVLMLLPEARLAVAVLANSAQAMESVMRTARHALGLMLEAKTGVRQPEGEERAAGRDARYPPALPESFAGRYDTPMGVADIRHAGGRLTLEIGGKTLTLRPRKNGYLGLEYRVLGVLPLSLGKLGEHEFTRARLAGHEVLLARERGVFHLAGERLDPVPIPTAWLARRGHYRYVGEDALMRRELGETPLRLFAESGDLLVEIASPEGRARLALAALDDDHALVRGLGRGRGERVQARRTGDAETLHYAGLTFRRIAGENHA